MKQTAHQIEMKSVSVYSAMQKPKYVLRVMNTAVVLFIALFFLSLCVCFRAILLTCNLFSFNADVNWLPGSASPYGYYRQPVL